MTLEVGSSGDAVFGAKKLATGDATITIDDYQVKARSRLLIKIEQRRCPKILCR
jgi:hypothetical protein